MAEPPQRMPNGRRPPAYQTAREKLLSLSWQWQCTSSPSGAHHWQLDQGDYGTCKHCGESRQFGLEEKRSADSGRMDKQDEGQSMS
jgi:hypothetical protein